MNRRKFLNWMGLSWLASTSPIVIGAILARSETKPPFVSQTSSTQPITFYISPLGNDRWSGKLATPNSEQTDGPLATLEAARNRIRELKRQQSGNLNQAIKVLLRTGTYYLTQPLLFTPEDSGTANFPITYAAYPNERPLISAGRRITGWQPETIDGKRLWVAELPEVGQGKWFFRELWANGQRRTRARHPNKGYLKIAAVPDLTEQTSIRQGQNRFKFYPGDIKNWATINQAEVVLMNFWMDSRMPVVRVDENQSLIECTKRSIFRMEPTDKNGTASAIYYIENALEILDSPGEWFLNAKTGKLYYMPLAGEDINNTEIIAPSLTKILSLQGKTDSFVEHLSFENLAFAHSEWYYPNDFKHNWPAPDVGGFHQAAYGIPGAIFCQSTRNCIWKNCQVAHIGNYGIEFSTRAYLNEISNCEFFDLGAGGVKIADGSWSIKVKNSHIYDGGRLFHGAVGILIQEAPENHIFRNHIHDFYYSGISVGWSWGYDERPARDNRIESNHIHHIGIRSDGDGPLLNDKGGIYTLGVQPGTVIIGNIIHDIQAYNYGAWGIYLDEGSSEISIINNLVYRTRDGGFHIHYGRDNVVRNNIFAFGKIAQIRRSSAENNLSFTFQGNIIYWNEGKLLEGKWEDSKFVFDKNLYWRVNGGDIRFADISWDEWHKKGMDKESLIADPLFIAADQGDFRLNPNSPAFKLGFQPISLENRQT
ncbi:MAG TPA: right-handed parallel beta-helix repeat-containing protein [Halomicronema sp.]